MVNPPTFVSPPAKIPLPWRWLLRMVEKKLGGTLEANRILTWSPRLTLGTALMEALVVHDDPEVPRRLLKLLRVFTSYRVSCPFCIDLNGNGFEGDGVTALEVQALASAEAWSDHEGFSAAERAALNYALCLTVTPVKFPDAVIVTMKQHFSDRAFTLIATTVAQVNFWARLIQGLGVSEAGFSADLQLLSLERFRTRSIPGK